MPDSIPLQALLPMLQWCHGPALRQRSLARLTEALVHQLRALGVPVWRLSVTLPTLHPQQAAECVVWEDGVTELVPREWEGLLTQGYLESPLKVLLEGEAPRVVETIHPEGPLAFPVLEDFRARGHTAYAGYAIPAERDRPNMVTLTTRAPQGFTPEVLAVLETVIPALAPVLQIYELRGVATSICRTYLGPITGPRVLAGAIHRGSVETLEAVVWFCDLRGFTRMSQELDSSAMVDLLNGFFGAVAQSVDSHEGEILKFIGDAALAIFPVRTADQLPHACQAALAAAHEARRRVREFDPSLRFGIGLHVGEVSYGNIGAPDRLDFTVIGPAVNLASRLESLCATQRAQLLASEDFAQALGEGLSRVGDFELKGIQGVVPVYGLPRDLVRAPETE